MGIGFWAKISKSETFSFLEFPKDQNEPKFQNYNFSSAKAPSAQPQISTLSHTNLRLIAHNALPPYHPRSIASALSSSQTLFPPTYPLQTVTPQIPMPSPIPIPPTNPHLSRRTFTHHALTRPAILPPHTLAPPSPSTTINPLATILDLLPKISSHPSLASIQVRCGPRATYDPSHRVRKRRHGFLARLRSRTGRMMLKRRKQKGRGTLSH